MEPPGHKPLVVNVLVVGPFEEEEEVTGVTSDVVKVKGEDPATPGPLKRNDPGTVTIPQYRVNKTKQHTHTPKYSSQSRFHNSLTVEWERRSVNPLPWRFTNNSLGLLHAQSFSIYLSSSAYVVCACFLLYLAVYLCFARCVFCDPWYIHFNFFHSSL